MISSIHFPDKTYENLLDLIGHKKEKYGQKLSASKMVSQLIDKEYDQVKPPRYEKGKEASNINGVQKQPDGEQNATAPGEAE